MREKLSDKIILRIQRDISTGKYQPGDRIPAEPELMKRYKVGRSTIREAVKTLAIAGVLNVQQGSGTFIRETVSDETLEQRLRRGRQEEVNAVRSLLENELIRLSVQHRTQKDLSDIKRCLKQRQAALDSEDYEATAAADIAFHLAVARSSHNYVLADLYQSFTRALRSSFTARDQRQLDHFRKSTPWHEALYQALITRDEAEARSSLQHIIRSNKPA